MAQADNPNSFSEASNKSSNLEGSNNIAEKSKNDVAAMTESERGKLASGFYGQTPEGRDAKAELALVFDIGNPKGVESLAAYYKLPDQKWNEHLAKLSWNED